jgi:hypothetical protein
MSCIRSKHPFEPPSAMSLVFSIEKLNLRSLGPNRLIVSFEMARAFLVNKLFN